MKKRGCRALCLVLALCLALGLALPAGAVAVYRDFQDLVQENEYANYINQSFLEGFFYGTSVSTFAPDRELTRGEAVTVLGRVHERLTGATVLSAAEDPYPDVKSTRFYGKYIAWAREAGVLTLEESENFRPNEPALQGDVGTWLTNYLTLLLEETITGKLPEHGALLELIRRWKDPQERQKLLEPAPDAAHGTREFPLLYNTGANSSMGIYDERDPESRRVSAAVFVDFYQALALDAEDRETPRAQYEYRTNVTGPAVGTLREDGEETPAPEETAPGTWTYFSVTGIRRDKGRTIQRGYEIVTDYETYRERLALLEAAGALAPKTTEAPLLEVDEAFFLEHDLLLAEANGFLNTATTYGLTEFTLEPNQTAPEGEEQESSYTAKLRFLAFNYLGEAETDQVAGTVVMLAVPKGTNITGADFNFQIWCQCGQPIGASAIEQ